MQELPEALNRMSERVIGAAIEVHRCLGPGLLESVYEAALCREFELRDVPFARQVHRRSVYKGMELPPQRFDLVVAGQVVLELKAVESVSGAHLAQLLSYLRLGGYPLGLLINFHTPVLRRGIERRINSVALSNLRASASSAFSSANSAFQASGEAC